MEILHDVIKDTLSAQDFLRNLVRKEFPHKCTEENIAESIKYLNEMKQELKRRGGENSVREYPDKMTFEGLPKYLCHDPEDARCQTPPHHAARKGGTDEGTVRVTDDYRHQTPKSKSPTVTSATKGKSGRKVTNVRLATRGKSGGNGAKAGSAAKEKSKAKGVKRKRSYGKLKEPRGEGKNDSDQSQCDEILRGNVDELLEYARIQTAKLEQLTGDLECVKGTLKNILERLDMHGLINR